MLAASCDSFVAGRENAGVAEARRAHAVESGRVACLDRDWQQASGEGRAMNATKGVFREGADRGNQSGRSASTLSSAARMLSRLSARRRVNAQQMLDHLHWHG